MDIKSAKYIKDTLANDGSHSNIRVILNNGVVMAVPINTENSDYVELMRQVDAGELTIEEAD
jgi:hypothetical protein|tara:strand:- start:20282 stop:20467 length:186 start_codon:yes stop_codon:yes gene_type:complete